jgi:hypothetical protein
MYVAVEDLEPREAKRSIGNLTAEVEPRAGELICILGDAPVCPRF